MANTAKHNHYTKIDITTQYMYVRVGGRCMQCEGCCSVNCGVCIYCKDKKKFGGTGKRKKACIKRTCVTQKVYNVV